MGGNIGFIIKKEDGEQIGMSRWTNIIPHFFKDPNLYLGNTKEWFADFAKEWLKMKEDYEKNKDTGKFALNMTPVYFPHETKSPDEYGIIAVDFQNKKIYSSQDYSGVGNLQFYNFWSQFEDEEEKTARLKKFVETGLIKEVSLYDTEKNESTVVNLSNFTLENIITMLDEISDRRVKEFSNPLLKDFNKKNIDNYFSHFIISSEWKFVIYHDRSLGVLKIKKELDKDGFTFSEQDNESWKEYLSYGWSDYNAKDEETGEDTPEYVEFKTLYQEVFNEEFVLREED